MITVEIGPLTVFFEFQKLKFHENTYCDVDFDSSHFRPCSSECFTLENHAELFLQLKFTIVIEI